MEKVGLTSNIKHCFLCYCFFIRGIRNDVGVQEEYLRSFKFITNETRESLALGNGPLTNFYML